MVNDAVVVIFRPDLCHYGVIMAFAGG